MAHSPQTIPDSGLGLFPNVGPGPGPSMRTDQMLPSERGLDPRRVVVIEQPRAEDEPLPARSQNGSREIVAPDAKSSENWALAKRIGAGFAGFVLAAGFIAATAWLATSDFAHDNPWTAWGGYGVGVLLIGVAIFSVWAYLKNKKLAPRIELVEQPTTQNIKDASLWNHIKANLPSLRKTVLIGLPIIAVITALVLCVAYQDDIAKPFDRDPWVSSFAVVAALAAVGSIVYFAIQYLRYQRAKERHEALRSAASEEAAISAEPAKRGRAYSSLSGKLTASDPAAALAPGLQRAASGDELVKAQGTDWRKVGRYALLILGTVAVLSALGSLAYGDVKFCEAMSGSDVGLGVIVAAHAAAVAIGAFIYYYLKYRAGQKELEVDPVIFPTEESVAEPQPLDLTDTASQDGDIDEDENDVVEVDLDEPDPRTASGAGSAAAASFYEDGADPFAIDSDPASVEPGPGFGTRAARSHSSSEADDETLSVAGSEASEDIDPADLPPPVAAPEEPEITAARARLAEFEHSGASRAKAAVAWVVSRTLAVSATPRKATMSAIVNARVGARMDTLSGKETALFLETQKALAAQAKAAASRKAVAEPAGVGGYHDEQPQDEQPSLFGRLFGRKPETDSDRALTETPHEGIAGDLDDEASDSVQDEYDLPEKYREADKSYKSNLNPFAADDGE